MSIPMPTIQMEQSISEIPIVTPGSLDQDLADLAKS